MTAGKHREEGMWYGYDRAALYGILAFGIMLILLFAASLICGRYHPLAEKIRLTAIVCIAVTSLLCGCLCAGTCRVNRFPHALAGEGVFLLLTVLLGLIFGFRGGWQSALLDIGIMFFGAFAGAIIRGGIRNRRPKRR